MVFGGESSYALCRMAFMKTCSGEHVPHEFHVKYIMQEFFVSCIRYGVRKIDFQSLSRVCFFSFVIHITGKVLSRAGCSA